MGYVLVALLIRSRTSLALRLVGVLVVLVMIFGPGFLEDELAIRQEADRLSRLGVPLLLAETPGYGATYLPSAADDDPGQLVYSLAPQGDDQDQLAEWITVRVSAVDAPLSGCADALAVASGDTCTEIAADRWIVAEADVSLALVAYRAGGVVLTSGGAADVLPQITIRAVSAREFASHAIGTA